VGSYGLWSDAQIEGSDRLLLLSTNEAAIRVDDG